MSKKTNNHLIAARYAKALLGLAGSDAPSLAQSAAVLAEACRDAEVQCFLHNPLLSRTQGAQIVGTVLDKAGAPKLLKDTAMRMANNRRLPVLPNMLEQFVQMVEAQQGIMRVKIISAKELTKADVAALSDKIAAQYNCKVNAETQVDASIIGGIQLQMGDKRIDYSVAGKLERLKTELKNTPIATKG